MKTSCWSVAIFGTTALVLILQLDPVAAQLSTNPPLNLDANPKFDFGGGGQADPLFAPALLGLTNGMAGFDRAAAVAAFAQAAVAAFPPSAEVFLAYVGNPGYALFPGAVSGLGPLAAGSPLSLVAAFRGGSPNIMAGRTDVFDAGEPTRVLLGGTEYVLTEGIRIISPLVLDLDQDGVLSASRSEWLPHPSRLTGPYAAFDIDGDGYAEVMEWLGPGDGLLVTSPKPQSGHDLVGCAGGWTDGFEHLAAVYDLDHNGRVEGAELNGLYVWRDLNANGVAEPGEVVSVQGLGIAWIAATNSANYTSSFGQLDSRPGLVWDWWPNYARAGRRSAFAAGGGLLGGDHGAGLFDKASPQPYKPGAHMVRCRQVHAAQLAAAGIDLSSFRMAALADEGNSILGYDLPPGRPRRLRLLQIKPSCSDTCVVAGVELPFEQVFQLACDPSGQKALVLGDEGSQLAAVDFNARTVAPAEGLELRRVGLRASGVAGYNGLYWFTAWQLDGQGAVIDERVWALTPWGFWGGLSLDTLRNEFGQLRSYYLTGPTSGFFATPAPGGTNETLWSISDTGRVAVVKADSFGGLYAVPGKVACTARDGAHYVDSFFDVLLDYSIDHATNSEPYSYPFLTDGGGSVIAATLSPADGALTYWVATNSAALAPGHSHVTPLLTTAPGQGKVSRGAFAHYSTNGIEVIPLSDPPPEPPVSRVWNYVLLPGSQLIDDCPVCGRPTIIVPLQGAFQMRLVQENPLFSTYAWEGIAWTAGTPGGTTYRIAGGGTFQVGGEVGRFQDLILAVSIDSGWTNRLCYFTNGVPMVERLWPMVRISVDQTNGLDLQQYHLDLLAAPMREIWFSTKVGFHAGIWEASTNYVSPGDLISSAGRVVKRNNDLTRYLGLQPIVPDLGLDAVDVLPGGKIAFSVEQDVFSETLGSLYSGDVLSDRGLVVTNYAALIGAFGPEPPPPDEGLDALQVMPNGEIYFSVTNEFFSELLGRTIWRGDLLSSRGVIVKTNLELVASFHPADPKKDYGLDAIYVWPSGEIWFSTETGFSGQHFEPYLPGDLLSDQGYVVYRNLDLLSAFEPLEDLYDFGLDALFVVTDATASPPAPRCTALEWEAGTGNLTLQFEGLARVFQLEKATNVLGPWRPLSSIGTDLRFTDEGALNNQPQGFYRLRTW